MYGVGGDRITLYGYNFAATTDTVTVFIDGLPCTCLVAINDSAISCDLPGNTIEYSCVNNGEYYSTNLMNLS